MGIGTSAPQSKVHINDAGGITGDNSNLMTIESTDDTAAAISFNTGFEQWTVGQNRPPDISLPDDFFIYNHDDGISHLVIQNVTGRVGIGTTAPSHLLHVNGVARSTQALWATSSDARVKKNVQTLSGSLQKLLELRPVTFEYTRDYIGDNEALEGQSVGFIAQEIKEIFPDMVSMVEEGVGNKTIDDFLVLDPSNLVPMLVDAIKEIKTEKDREIKTLRENLKAKTLAIQEQVAKLQAENKHLHSEINAVKELRAQFNKLRIQLTSIQNNKTHNNPEF